MASQPRAKICVKNLGPVREGEFELQPLTIFIGPNNSGKSYVALLVYSLCKAMSGNVHWPFLTRGLVMPEDISEERWNSLRGRLNALRRKGTAQQVLRISDIDEDLREVLQRATGRRFASLEEDLPEALRDYFGCSDVNELVRREVLGKESLVIHLNERDGRPPLLALKLARQGPSNEPMSLNYTVPEIDSVNLPFPDPDALRFWASSRLGPPRLSIFDNLADMIWNQLMIANGLPRGDAYYLPAARSGILQGWQLFATMAVQMLRRRVGLERIEVPPFTGVAGDFLQVLWERVFQERRRRQDVGKFDSVLEVLEGQVFHGEVALEIRRSEQPLIFYKSGAVRLPLQRASSMVGELAPLDLWVRNLLQPGDLLVIDEPEAHQHPENQRKVATALVRLVNAGVHVLCTTHSSMILHQVSNHLLATEASPRERRRLGFSESDLLEPGQVGVYLFGKGEDGTQIISVPIEQGFGISEEEFVRVADAIGEETYRLSMSLPHEREDS
jgi:predicted ATPase